MIEIRTNVMGDIICKETEDAKGLGTLWIFEDLQKYVTENKVTRNVLHHLTMMSVYQMERICELSLKDSEIIRLTADLERMIMHLYYNDTERNFEVRLVEDELEFTEDGNLLQRITLKRFEDDLKYEPDPKENSIQLINFALEGRRLNNREIENLASQMVDIYETLLSQRAEEAAKSKK